MKDRKYAKDLTEAKKIFKAKTGADFKQLEAHHSGIRIYRFKKANKTPTRKFFIGSHIEYINR